MGSSAMRLYNDGAALPALLEVMRAAGAHDLDAVRAAATAAHDAIGSKGPHKARPDINDALTAAETGDWVLCWGRAWQATCGLTHAFPPDKSICPPIPVTTPHVVVDCVCGTTLRAGSRFCHACGLPVA